MFNKENFHKAMSLEVVRLDNHKFAIEERNGNISFNLTMMGKPYQKRPADWLKYQPAQEYLNELSVVSKIVTADLLEVRQGGTPERQGTWTNDYRVAIEFARWLNPKFSIAVNELVFKILTKQVSIAKADAKHGVSPMIWDGRPLYAYTDMLRALGGSTRTSASKRKARHPQHFVKIFGRNFVTSHYVDLLAGYYTYRNAQLVLNFGGQA